MRLVQYMVLDHSGKRFLVEDRRHLMGRDEWCVYIAGERFFVDMLVHHSFIERIKGRIRDPRDLLKPSSRHLVESGGDGVILARKIASIIQFKGMILLCKRAEKMGAVSPIEQFLRLS